MCVNYTKLAKKIKEGYEILNKYKEDKLFYLQTSEITIENDAGFKAIIVGNTSGISKSRGYMYLFYSNDDKNISFPTIKEIERRLRIVGNKEILTDNDADYFDWNEYESLEKQREYFSEIVIDAATNT